MDLSAAVANVTSSATLCLCPFHYSDATQSCPTNSSEPAVIVDQGQEITIECVQANGGGKCIFGCPQTILHVKSGGALTLKGNGEMELTGGIVYSRILVESSAFLHLDKVTFSK